ncbi:MAG: gamma-glutamyltransferase [Gammaproteobacteria bacterium]|nr:gamma-glutamyltransferase [Gammaproteobacteria bacterium]MCW8993141.1 gamma-glutamyltransferase [Gammaproteobacteria bacterium]
MRILVTLLLLLPCLVLASVEKPPASAIASAHPLATEAGMEILQAGGNAFDAAVAVSAALAVVEPYSSGIGGGGFWLLHRAEDGFETMLDGRERAPLAAQRDMYLDAEGEVIPGLSMDGPLAAGIPGEPAALAHLSEHYGRLTLARSLVPAIRLAREGFPVTEHYRKMATFRLPVLRRYPQAAAIFLKGGEVPSLGHLIRQPALARTLEAMAQEGADGFYRGPVAKALIEAVTSAGGNWQHADLQQYEVVEREPIRSDYRGLRITSAAPPSSGGVALATMLNILEQFPLERLDKVQRSHLVVEAMRRAYRDRAEYLGDTDFVEVPLQRLTSSDYAAGLAASVRLDRATASHELPSATAEIGGNHTTHFSILDHEGNYVSATLSINYPFGSGFVAAGTGVLLNDEMDDFSAKPGSPNAYGLVGAEANAIAPGKRMLSSMSPTFVSGPDGVAILGTPGGSRIITMVLLGILEVADGKGAEGWVSRPRFHHQYLPDTLYYEADAFDEDEAFKLEALGHRLERAEGRWGNMQAVHWHKKENRVEAASDPRVEGLARVREQKQHQGVDDEPL